jgi:ubiquinone/menaquinone biosynthesis C-methylase UbiE
MNNYYEGLNEKLLAVIPPSRKVLELGCAAGRLGEKYKQSHPNTTWVGVDSNADALEFAAKRLDATFHVGLDGDDSLDAVGEGFDCVVMGDLLEHLKQPEKVLEKLAQITTETAFLACCVPNASHISMVERMLLGDTSYDDCGHWDRTHLRFYSCSSLFKILLDSGWLPSLRDTIRIGHKNMALAQKLAEAARLLSVPPDTASRFLFDYQLLALCKKRSKTVRAAAAPAISVIATISSDLVPQLNVLRSPGLKEINAQVMVCQGASSAAEAFNAGVKQASSDWIILCHQDVYFPKHSGHEIANILSHIPQSEASRTILGFTGLSVQQSAGQLELAKAGLVVDRISLLDYPESQSAVSIDEMAVVVHRDCVYKIDPRLGWHLWATDLCLQAIFDQQKRTHARLIRVPLFHNSVSDWTLSPAFHSSGQYLAAKYPQLEMIPTLCGNIMRSPSALRCNPANDVNAVIGIPAVQAQSIGQAAR